MEFKQYPSYKNSGVEWLGDVPDEWDIYPFWHLFNRKEITNKTQEQLLSVYLDRGVILHSEGGGMVHKPADNLEKYQLVEVNDFVMNNQQAWRGSVGVSPYKGIVSPAYLIFSFNKKICAPKFFKYFLRDKGVVDQFMIASMSVGTIQRQVKWHLLKTIQLSIPSLIEQNTIANFLDTETARIDNLISKQEKLIELLEEQRKSIISHAVTKGLNPNAPMKDSGVEWLGDVPEHWMTPSSKHLLEIPITDGPHETPNFVDDGVPFISAEAISKGKIDFDKKRGYITPELNAIYSKKYSPKIEDIYMVKSGATTGKVAMVETTEEFNIWSPLAVFRCNKNKVLPKFLLAVFNSSHFYDALVLNWSYGTQQNIGMGVLSNIEIPCPPLKEQAEIIQHLDAQNTKFDKLISTQSQLIEKLKEYRSSIISHAVTGKIEVREFGA
ncbi:restriction endonuclease subunit S [Acinetobacter haemolyticus]|uniref:Restriction endonuclease subunit S n=1 Tax=Acinetobacter haemolyticus TaxID=29430 RepID=A0A857IFV9_ACIHA|nr:restriction endonuclease subunit S [Acinetobacter haemolyticus]QHI08712.1 restriction endonuclease subunit S [Acinetobacter haemolyticus]QHI11979.1 restriction endonuclease subunit S [Acinetobacter haemolyticus]